MTDHRRVGLDALVPGTRVGAYEVVALLGVGGMGEVYRARDTKLNRDVAIKVLLPAVANDPDRLARFSREAQVLASLNHPNIAHIHGLEESGGVTALVLELVEGEDLAQRIARGPIPLDEALPIARQIAEALEAAHDHGIIHRDLKPANIKVRADSTVKVLDFGLAKAIEPGSGNRAPGSADAMNSPTLSIHATEAGIILGTAAYMSPEQARGKAVDRRADIWAFGVVLFEMLTGKRAFAGDDISDTIVSVLRDDPDWTALAPNTPTTIHRLLRRCLQKDRKRRLDSAADAVLDLDDALTAPTIDASIEKPVHRGGATWLALAATGLILGSLGAAAGWAARTPPAAELLTFGINTPASRRIDGFALSPDGRQLAFAALDSDGQERLWIRPLATAGARLLPGTEGAYLPFWSPDSRSVAFFTVTELKRIEISGGGAQTIARRTSGAATGGTWSDQQVILFGLSNAAIFRVAAAGGEPESVTTLQPGALAHHWPVFMPDGRHFIYLENRGPAEDGQLLWRALDGSEERMVRKMTSKCAYSSTGHLLFRLEGPIVAQRFDATRGTISGEPVQVAADTMQTGVGTALALSTAGVLAHRAGQSGERPAQLSWLDRAGTILGVVGRPANYWNPSLNLAGDRVAVNTVGISDVWVLDDRRGTTSRLTFDPEADSDAIFSPDGTSLAFYSARKPPGIYRKAANGAGADELAAATGAGSYPRDWSVDGRYLAYDVGPAGTIWILPMDGEHKAFPYLSSPGPGSQVSQPHFSPDSRWVAYASNETSRPEIFVQNFPAAGGKFQVSVTGGTEPRWRRDGRELYFLGADGRMMAVDVETVPAFRLGVPKPLFQTQLNMLTAPARRYGVSADGRRFLMQVPVGAEVLAPITVIVNWQTALMK
ncbi:MAG: protein kinase [Acidobacteriota bacterium]|nr:protein kinase [Acidobacteriota bacterium]